MIKCDLCSKSLKDFASGLAHAKNHFPPFGIHGTAGGNRIIFYNITDAVVYYEKRNVLEKNVVERIKNGLNPTECVKCKTIFWSNKDYYDHIFTHCFPVTTRKSKRYSEVRKTMHRKETKIQVPKKEKEAALNGDTNVEIKKDVSRVPLEDKSLRQESVSYAQVSSNFIRPTYSSAPYRPPMNTEFPGKAVPLNPVLPGVSVRPVRPAVPVRPILPVQPVNPVVPVDDNNNVVKVLSYPPGFPVPDAHKKIRPTYVQNQNVPPEDPKIGSDTKQEPTKEFKFSPYVKPFVPKSQLYIPALNFSTFVEEFSSHPTSPCEQI